MRLYISRGTNMRLMLMKARHQIHKYDARALERVTVLSGAVAHCRSHVCVPMSQRHVRFFGSLCCVSQALVWSVCSTGPTNQILLLSRPQKQTNKLGGSGLLLDPALVYTLHTSKICFLGCSRITSTPTGLVTVGTRFWPLLDDLTQPATGR